MKINPKSVRNFIEYQLSFDGKNFSCPEERATDFFYSLISFEKEKLIFEITDPFIINQNDIILDGNLRFYLKFQLEKIKNTLPYEVIFKQIPVKKINSSDDEQFLYQVKTNNKNPLSVKQKLEALNNYIKNYVLTDRNASVEEIRKHLKEKYGKQIYHYAFLLNQYNELPAWLKNEGERFNVNPTVLVRFHKTLESQSNWNKVIRNSIQTSVSKFRITDKNIDNVINSMPKSQALLSENIDTMELDEEQLREKSLLIFEKIIEKIDSVTLENYECKDWKKFLRLLDEFLYVISNI